MVSETLAQYRPVLDEAINIKILSSNVAGEQVLQFKKVPNYPTQGR